MANLKKPSTFDTLPTPLVAADELYTQRAAGDFKFMVSDVSDYVKRDVSSWATSERPEEPYLGQPGFNTSTGGYEYWNGSAWVERYQPPMALPTPKVEVVAIGDPFDNGYFPSNTPDFYNTKSLKLSAPALSSDLLQYNPQYWMWICNRGALRSKTGDLTKARQVAGWKHKVHMGGDARAGSKWYGGHATNDTKVYSIPTEWDYSPSLILDCMDDVTGFPWNKFFRTSSDDEVFDRRPGMYDMIQYAKVAPPRKGKQYVDVRFTLTIEDPSFGDYPFIHSAPSDVVRVVRKRDIGADVIKPFYFTVGVYIK